MTAFPTVPGQLNAGLPPMGQFPPVSLEQLLATLLSEAYGGNQVMQPPSLPPRPSQEWRAAEGIPFPPPPPQPPEAVMQMAAAAEQQHRQMGTAPEETLQPQIPSMVWGGNQAVPPPDMRQRRGPQMPDWFVDKARADQQRAQELAAVNATAIAAMREAQDRKIKMGQGAFGYNPMEDARSLYRGDDPGQYVVDQIQAMEDAKRGVPPQFRGAWFGPAIQREGQEIPMPPAMMPRPSFELTPEQQANITARKEKRDTAQGLITARARGQTPAGYRADIGEASPVDLAMLGGAEAAAVHPDVMAQAAEQADLDRQMEIEKAKYAVAAAMSQIPGMTPAGFAKAMEAAGAGTEGVSPPPGPTQDVTVGELLELAPSEEVRTQLTAAIADEDGKALESIMIVMDIPEEERDRLGRDAIGPYDWDFRDWLVGPTAIGAGLLGGALIPDSLKDKLADFLRGALSPVPKPPARSRPSRKESISLAPTPG